MLGDFNVHIDKPDRLPDVKKFNTSLRSSGLYQHIHERYTLHLIITHS